MEETLSLTQIEVQVLQQLLQGDLSRLVVEISHTDHRAMKDRLKEREAVLRGIIERLA